MALFYYVTVMIRNISSEHSSLLPYLSMIISVIDSIVYNGIWSRIWSRGTRNGTGETAIASYLIRMTWRRHHIGSISICRGGILDCVRRVSRSIEWAPGLRAAREAIRPDQLLLGNRPEFWSVDQMHSVQVLSAADSGSGLSPTSNGGDEREDPLIDDIRDPVVGWRRSLMLRSLSGPIPIMEGDYTN